MTDSEKLSKSKRQQLVAQCLIDRFTEVETQKYIYDHTNNQVSISTIERDKRRISEQATRFFYLLAKDNHEYNSKLKITLDSLESTLSDLKKEYNKSTDIITKLKITDSLLKYEKEVFEYYKYLPTINQLEPEPEYTNTSTSTNTNTNTKACADSAGPISTQQTEELYGLEFPPWDDNHWSQCCKCQRWFKTELVEGICHNCSAIPQPIV
jgi:hypothetical protein